MDPSRHEFSSRGKFPPPLSSKRCVSLCPRREGEGELIDPPPARGSRYTSFIPNEAICFASGPRVIHEMGKPRFEIWISIYRSRSILDGSEARRRIGWRIDWYRRWNKNHRLTSAIPFFSIVLNINCSFKRRRECRSRGRFKTVFNIADIKLEIR